METTFIGIILGAVLIGFVALITITVRLAFVISEMATIVKSIYISTNKIEQIAQATMEASENFVDALSRATQEHEQEKQQPPFFQIYRDGPFKDFKELKEFLESRRNNPASLDADDLEELRGLFEEHSNDDDDDTDTHPKEPWKE